MKKRIVWAILLILCIPVVAFAAGFTSDVTAINEAAKSVLMLEVYQDDTLIGTGSGFVVGNNRMLVTNCHVIEGGDMIVGLSDEGYSYLLNKVLAADEAQDIAILGFMSPTDLNPLTFNTGEILRAEPVVAIGSPQGMLNTISMGNVSGLFADGTIQFTAPISNGSSGGALFNDRGEVIGVTTSAIAPDGNVVQNLNFAVNASSVLDLLNTVNEKDYVSLGDYSNGMLPGPTPEPTVTPEPAPKKESKVHDVNMQWNHDGTVTFSWFDYPTQISQQYYIGINNYYSGNDQIRMVSASSDSYGYYEATLNYDVYYGDRIKFAIEKSYDNIHRSLSYSGIKDSVKVEIFIPTEASLADYEELSIGASGTAVKDLQKKLIEYGYLKGASDGIYGKQTAQAVCAFSEHLLLEKTEIATQILQVYLFEGAPYRMQKWT